jgi:hypothetical protein
MQAEPLTPNTAMQRISQSGTSHASPGTPGERPAMRPASHEAPTLAAAKSLIFFSLGVLVRSFASDAVPYPKLSCNGCWSLLALCFERSGGTVLQGTRAFYSMRRSDFSFAPQVLFWLALSPEF